jgi:hypothetical protein
MTNPRTFLIIAVVLIGSCDTTNVEESALESTALLENQTGKRSERVEICHARNSAYHLLEIDSAAVEGHLRHGDGFPGDPIPDLAGFQFDDACEPMTACPCFSIRDIVNYPFNMHCFWYDTGSTSIWCPAIRPPDQLFGVGGGLGFFCWSPNWPASTVFDISISAQASCRWNILEAARQLDLDECPGWPDGIGICY